MLIETMNESLKQAVELGSEAVRRPAGTLSLDEVLIEGLVTGSIKDAADPGTGNCSYSVSTVLCTYASSCYCAETDAHLELVG